LVVERFARKADDGKRLRQELLAREIVQRRDELALRQIAGGAEDDNAARIRGLASAKAGAGWG